VPWLDDQTAALVHAIAASVARRHPDLRAGILYGSVARHEERPLTDSEPSDVDLLLLVEEYLSEKRLRALYHTVGERAHSNGVC
jgi:predicted nucleotidyltransferase